MGCPYFFSMDGKYEAGPITFFLLFMLVLSTSLVEVIGAHA
jgi:hypothetical protein